MKALGLKKHEEVISVTNVQEHKFTFGNKVIVALVVAVHPGKEDSYTKHGKEGITHTKSKKYYMMATFVCLKSHVPFVMLINTYEEAHHLLSNTASHKDGVGNIVKILKPTTEGSTVKGNGLLIIQTEARIAPLSLSTQHRILRKAPADDYDVPNDSNLHVFFLRGVDLAIAGATIRVANCNGDFCDCQEYGSTFKGSNLRCGCPSMGKINALVMSADLFVMKHQDNLPLLPDGTKNRNRKYQNVYLIDKHCIYPTSLVLHSISPFRMHLQISTKSRRCSWFRHHRPFSSPHQQEVDQLSDQGHRRPGLERRR